MSMLAAVLIISARLKWGADDDAEYKYEDLLGETEHVRGVEGEADLVFDKAEHVEKDILDDLHLEGEAEVLIGSKRMNDKSVVALIAAAMYYITAIAFATIVIACYLGKKGIDATAIALGFGYKKVEEVADHGTGERDHDWRSLDEAQEVEMTSVADGTDSEIEAGKETEAEEGYLEDMADIEDEDDHNEL